MTIETRPAVVPAEPRVKTVADVLRHAALLIEERGWCQVDFERDDGAHCMVGAIIAVTRYDGLGVEAHRFMMSHGYGIGFNDASGRTASEVTAALRAAADAAERS